MVAGEIPRPVDVLVIGAGPGGYTAAARAVALGRAVTIVEQTDHIGGTCLNVGCIPSKALISVANDLARARSRITDQRGLAGNIALDFPAAQRWKHGIVEQLRDGVRRLLEPVEIVNGTARFVGRDRVAVESADHVEHLQFRDAVVATGSRPLALPGLPFDGRRVVDSSGALAFADVPPDLVVVGGGYIGVELGSAYAKLGSAVTIIELADRILTEFDDDVAAVVSRRLAELGVVVRTGARVAGDDGATVEVTIGDTPDRIAASAVLVCAGRRPNTDDLQLEDVGLTVDGQGRIPVDAQQRTSVPSIYAVGDVTSGPALAHKAYAEARVAAEAMCGQPSEFASLVPLVAFCDPEIAMVGVGEREARDSGRDVVVGRATFGTNGRALTLEQAAGLLKVVVDVDGEFVVGAAVAGPEASELIAELTLAVECGLRLDDLSGTVHAHPTLAEAIVDAARSARVKLDKRTLAR